MKKMRKAVSIILFVFMLMQMIPGAVSAQDFTPKNIRWATQDDLYWGIDVSEWIVWDLVGDYTDYVVYIYKDGVLVEEMLTTCDDENNVGYEEIGATMKQYGTGSYTVKAATFGGSWEDYVKYQEEGKEVPVLATSEESVPYNYVGEAKTDSAEKPQQTAAPSEPADSEKVNNENNAQSETPAPVTAEKSEIECPLAVKICYDLKIMPDVYENADKFVTGADFERVCANLFEEKYNGRGGSENLNLDQICKKLAGYMVPGGSSMFVVTKPLSSGVELNSDSLVTYAQLAKIVYNALNGYYTIYSGGYLVDETGMMRREGREDVSGGLLYAKGYEKYSGTVNISGNEATVSGKLYNKENHFGKSVENVKLSVYDESLKSGSDYAVYAKDGEIVCMVSYSGLGKEKVTNNLTPPTIITLKIGDVNATVDGKNVVNDVVPMVVNNRTMLPIRFVAEELGASVAWSSATNTVKIQSADREIYVNIGAKTAIITQRTNEYGDYKEEKIDLDSPAFVENDRTYLPVRFVAEALGADVGWDAATQSVTITKR